jgi:hypothetical protein
MGHEDITTTEIYLHVAMGANGLGVQSPLDTLEMESSAEEQVRIEDGAEAERRAA